MSFTLPKIYPITDVSLSGISHAEQVERLISGGATLIQLREKHASPRDFFEAAKPAVEIARKNDVKIVINDRVDIARALGADGVHLGQDDLRPDAARHILGPDAIIGYSTHSVEQALRAAVFNIDYIAIGPIFKTTTKEKPDPVVGLDGLGEVKEQLGNIPLVAIGGIDLDNIREVLAAGAESVALVSALIRDAASISATTKGFLNIVKSC
ncbi:MAG TPA: thiamine phosphate synthase [Pyrinomonadaceae bacterium]|nr:thiamine phosphate synthase [Pyrinomonadaceae bacterium]